MESDILYIYDNEYFIINKKLQMISGLWPYAAPADKIFRRIIVTIILAFLVMPHINGVRIWCGKDLALCGENLGATVYAIGTILKYSVTILYEEKIKRVYLLVAQNWLSIADNEEKEILIDYAKQGKVLGVGYLAYMSFAGFAFSQFTMMPTVLDIILPLNESRPKILVAKGEYMVDPYQYYYEIYFAYCIFAVTSVIVFTGVDTTYVAVVHQSLGIFNIAKHRLYRATSYADDVSRNGSYDMIISAIELHKDALQFIDIIETSYNFCFLLLIGLSIVFLSVGAITILEHMDDTLDFLRMSMFELGIVFHLFYLSWPGQKVIDHSSDLFLQIYTNKWYNISEKGKTLLKIMMLRCIKPCILTAGGFYILNFENYGALIKTTMSYITVAVSFRE